MAKSRKSRPPSRKKRTKEHITADAGVKHVETIAIEAGFVPVPVPGGSDYGVDLILFTFDHDGLLQNGDVRIQVKSAEKLVSLKDRKHFSFSVSKRDLSHWMNEIHPVILVRHDRSTRKAYWTYVQRYFQSLPGFDLAKSNKSVRIRVAANDVLDLDAMKTFASFTDNIVNQAGKAVRHV